MQAVRLARRWSRRNAERISTSLVERKAGTWDEASLLHPGHVAGVRQVDEPTAVLLEEAVERFQFVPRVAALTARAR